MKRNLRRNPHDRCLLCGLRTTLHFTEDNIKLSCQEAIEAHPHASVRSMEFGALLRLTRQERLEAMADAGCDTWEEARGER